MKLSEIRKLQQNIEREFDEISSNRDCYNEYCDALENLLLCIKDVEYWKENLDNLE